MDLLYAGNVDGFVIVSSDSDFTPLATRLRESGQDASYGVGQRKTPEGVPWRRASKFVFLEVLARRDAPQPPAPQQRRPRVRDRTSRGAICRAC